MLLSLLVLASSPLSGEVSLLGFDSDLPGGAMVGELPSSLNNLMRLFCAIFCGRCRDEVTR